jgi:hypothetical protein
MDPLATGAAAAIATLPSGRTKIETVSIAPRALVIADRVTWANERKQSTAERAPLIDARKTFAGSVQTHHPWPAALEACTVALHASTRRVDPSKFFMQTSTCPPGPLKGAHEQAQRKRA